MSVVERSTQQYFGFDPRSIPDCQLWLDAQDPNANGTIPSGGSIITTWTDKSASGKNFTATGTVTFNTNPSRLSTNGSSYLQNTTITNAIHTSFFVYQKTSTDGPLFTTSTLNISGFFPGNGSSPVTYIARSDATWYSQTSTIPNNAINMVVIQYDASGNILLRYNGSVNAQSTTSGTITRDRLTLFFRSNNNEYTTGSLYEVVYYAGALSTSQIQQVEGYLAWKWGLTTSRGIVGPTSISGLTLWLDGADSTTLFSDSAGTTLATVGGTIGYWQDKSGAGRHYTQSTSANRPLYDAIGSVTFNTTAHYLTYSGTWATGGWDVFTVSTPLTSTANWRTMWRGFTTDHPTLIESGSTRLGYYHNASLGFQQFGSLTFAGGTRRLLYVSISSSRAYSAALDGTVTTSAAGGTGTADTQMFYSLGSASAGGQPWGTINEVIIVPNTTLTQRQQLEGYLAWKWGLQANLPTSHPYYANFALPTSHPFRLNPPWMRSFQPNDIAGLQVWFDGLDPSGNGTTPANNSALSTWVDKSGSGNSGTASGTTPLYQTGSGVLFSTGGYNTTYSASLANESMFFVYTPTSVPDTITLAGPNDVGGRTITVNTNLRLESSSYFVGFGSVTSNSTVTLNQRCQSGYINTASSMIVTHNGVTYSPVSLSYTAGRTTRIGISGTNNAIPFKGTIHEVLAYNVALTASQRQQVEGYLAAKWGLASSLPTTQPYYNLRALPSTTIFTPISISNLTLWLDAAESSTITLNSGNVSAWRDKSANNYSFTQASTSIQPAYTQSALNNLPVISLIPTKGLSATTFSPNGLTNMNIFAVINNTASQNPSTNTLYQFLRWNETGSWGQVYMGAYTPFMEWRFGTGQAENKPFANFPSNIGAAYSVLSITKSGTSEPAYRNGTLLTTYTATNTTISGTGSTTSLGLANGSNNLAELIVYSGSLTTQQRQQIEGYLAWKWGLQNSLPTTHPYYKFRP